MHDKFHIVKYLNQGIDETRKEEVKTEPLLKKAKYVMLKKIENMNEKQRQKFDEINAANLKTAKAWRMRENFMGLYQTQNSSYARYYFERWYKNVIHSNLPAMKKAAKTLKAHLEGIINTVEQNISNGRAEQINAKIQKLQSVGHGYRNFENFRVAILFFNGQLDMFSHSLR